MNKIVHIGFVLASALSAIAHADVNVTPPRIVLDVNTLAMGPAAPVQTDAGLVGVTRRSALPPVRSSVDSSSTCTRDRRGSVMSWGEGAQAMASTAEILTVGGQQYLDEATLVTEGDHVKVESHSRRQVSRIADMGPGVSAWAYRENGWIMIGAFVDFGNMSRMTTLGCRWTTTMIFARGGTGQIVSRPSFSDPVTYGMNPDGPKPHGPSFSIAASVSRSSVDAAPVLVVRATLLPESA